MVALALERIAARLAFRLPPQLLSLAAPRQPVEGQRLDPAIAAALAVHARRAAPALETLSPEAARREYKRQSEAFRGAPRPMRAVTELRAPGPAGPIPLRLYTPRGAPRPAPALVYYHGGGGVIGDLDTCDGACRLLADESGCLVASVDYRLAPEHPYPAGLRDALAAYRWFADAAAEFAADPGRVAVGGDSLGANLATNVARKLAGTEREPTCQLLIYPGLDLTASYPSRRTFGEGYLLTAALLDWFAAHYLQDPTLASDPGASPIFAEELAGSPPALVVTAGFDPLRDEGRAYADRLEAAGVPVRYHCVEGLVHGFLSSVDVIESATQATRACALALRNRVEAP